MRKLIVFLLFLIPIFGFADSEFLRDRGYLGISLGIGTQAPDGSLDVVGSEAYLPAPASVAADGNFSPSQWSMSLDEVANKFKLKAKESGGTTFEATIEQVRAGIHYNILKDSNPGLEDGVTTPFTASGSPTTFAITTANEGFDTNGLEWNSAAATTMESALVLIPPGLYGQQCEARFWVKGGSELLTFKVTDGTNELASRVMSTPSVYKAEKLLFVCPSSGSVDIEIAASADAPVAYFDDFYIGEAIENTAMGIATDEVDRSADITINGFGTVTEKEIFVRRVGNTMHMRGSFQGGTPAASQAQIVLPDGHTADLTGTAQTNMVGQYYNSSAGVLTFGGNAIFGPLHINTGGTNLLFAPSTSSALMENVDGNQVIGANQRVFFMVQVPITGWSAEGIGAPVELQGWFVDANLGTNDTSNIDIGIIAKTTYTPIGDTINLEITKNGDSAPVKIPCSGTVAPGTTTCSSGVGHVGGVFDAPLAGSYEACIQFAHRQRTGAGGSILTVFQLVETDPNDDSVIISEGGGRQSNHTQIPSDNSTDSFNVCGIFKFATPGEKALRLYFEQSVGGTVNESEVIVDRSSGNGQRDIQLIVKPIAPYMQAPKVISSLNTPSTDKTFALFSAYLSIDASNCVNTTEIGDWIDGTPTRVSAGRCSFSFKAGTFSGVPVCVCNALRGHPNSGYCLNQSVTQTGYDFYVSDEAGTEVNANVQLMCHGPR